VRFNQHVQGEYFILYERGEIPAGESEKVEDVRYLTPGDPSVDFGADARDTLVLAVPLRKVAPEAEAIELDLHFGAPEGESVDPRWAALEALRSRK
jgi:uncharacterized metal-binding protein YceD (DUF177 family)